jgi:chromosome partitioning protein
MEKGKVIVFSSQKGGVGKSTGAVNQAANFSLRGYDVLLVDTDPQGSAHEWINERRDNEDYDLKKISFEVQTGNKIHLNLKDKAEKYQFVIVDVAGVDTVEMRSALLAADIAIIPLLVSLFDVRTLKKLDRVLSLSLERNENLIRKVLQSRSTPLPRKQQLEREELQDLLSATETLENQLMDTIITERTVYRDANTQGMCVNEYLSRNGEVFSFAEDMKTLDKTSKKTRSKYNPVNEMIRLTDEIKQLLGI